MNIAFDLDGVLYPWHYSAYHYLTVNEKTTLGFTDFWVDCEDKLNKKMWDYLLSLPILYDNILPDKNKLRILEELSDTGHTIYYITGRCAFPDIVRVTQNYLDRYKFPQAGNLIFASDKVNKVNALEIDVFVEDMTKHLQVLVNSCRTVGIMQPWNFNDRDRLEELGVVFIPSVTSLLEVL